MHKDCHWLTGVPAWINDKNKVNRVGFLKNYPRYLIKAGYVHGEGWGFIQQESTFFSSKLYARTGGVDRNLKYAGDFLLWKKMAHYSKLTSINQPLAAFRIRNGQLSENLSLYYNEVYQNGGKRCKILRFLRKLDTLLFLAKIKWLS